MRNRLEENQGISTFLLWLITITTGLSVANLYYSQPLLELIRLDLDVSVVDVNNISICSQLGYALGLFFIIPLGDMVNRRFLILLNFGILAFSLSFVALSPNIGLILVASFITGLCSVTPQLFLPLVSQFSEPKNKSRNMGIVLSGLLVGILLSRVLSGVIGGFWGWRSMYYIATFIMILCFIFLYRFFPIILPSFKGRYYSLMKSMMQIVKEEPLLRFASVKAGFAFGSFVMLWAMLSFKMAQGPFYAGGAIVGLLGLCGVAGAFIASILGKYTDSIGTFRMNLLGEFLMVSGWICLFVFQDAYLGIIFGIIVLDMGMQCIQLGNQTAIFKLRPNAASRLNTIFMTTFFIGGTLATVLAGFCWHAFGWTGVVGVGSIFILISFLLNLYQNRSVFTNRKVYGRLFLHS